MKKYSNKMFIPLNNKNIIYHLFGMDIMIDSNFNLKVLEINIYPTHFLTGTLNNHSHSFTEKMLYPNGKKQLTEFIEYETQLLDEIYSLTIDTKFPTDYKPIHKYLVKV